MAYTDIDKPSDYFNTSLWSGDGNAQTISGVGFQPDWLWAKCRSDSYSNILTDSVRGITKQLKSEGNASELTNAQGVTAFNSDGYVLGTQADFAVNSNTFVGWAWKAGTSFTNDASATSIGTIDSTGSVNETAGFSICSYTGTGSNGTIKHGLSTVPHMIIQKNLTSGSHAWNVYHKNLTSAGYNLNLDDTYAEFTSATTWNSTAPTSSVFSVGTDTNANESGSGHISYIFSERKGYSKFSSYVGNGNADGPMIWTGFSPSFVMVHNTETASQWTIWDNKRSAFNLRDEVLYANGSGAEATATTESADFLSNGFKIRGSNSGINTSGEKYIFMAFAENPFVTSTGVPATAR